MPLIVLWRLLRSRRCPRAFNPETADLFLVPTWPGRSKQPWHPVCSQRANAEAMETLAHLSATTAHRHFFLVGKGHVKPNKLCDAWWRAPAGLLRRAMRFAYSSGYAMVPGKNRIALFCCPVPREPRDGPRDLRQLRRHQHVPQEVRRGVRPPFRRWLDTGSSAWARGSFSRMLTEVSTYPRREARVSLRSVGETS